MPEEMAAIAPTVVTAAIAALVAFLFSVLNEWIRERRAFAHRWDRDVFDLVVSVMDFARQLHHLSEGQDSTGLDKAHMSIRVEGAKLRVLAAGALGRAALEVQREAYAVVKTATGEPDPRPSALAPRERLLDAIDRFSDAARDELGLALHGVNRLEG